MADIFHKAEDGTLFISRQSVVDILKSHNALTLIFGSSEGEIRDTVNLLGTGWHRLLHSPDSGHFLQGVLWAVEFQNFLNDPDQFDTKDPTRDQQNQDHLANILKNLRELINDVEFSDKHSSPDNLASSEDGVTPDNL